MSTTPAFSPGPQITRGPSVGNVFSQIFDDLYEQCPLHIAEKMPSSVRFGMRPRIATARSNSSRLSPISAASSGVMLLPRLMAIPSLPHTLLPPARRRLGMTIGKRNVHASRPLGCGSRARAHEIESDQDQPAAIPRFQGSGTGDNRSYQVAPSDAPGRSAKFPQNREFFAIQQGIREGHFRKENVGPSADMFVIRSRQEALPKKSTRGFATVTQIRCHSGGAQRGSGTHEDEIRQVRTVADAITAGRQCSWVPRSHLRRATE